MKVNFQPRIFCRAPQSKVSFGSLPFSLNSYTDMYGVQRSTQNTTEKRSDLNYKNLAAIMETRFRHYDHVNIMPMNVSDATELYYITNAIVERCGFERFKSRYTPILATDVCGDVIKDYPMRGIVFLKTNEILELSPRILVPEDILKYEDVYIDSLFNGENCYKLYRLNDDYKCLFKCGICDFKKRLQNMKDEGNSVVIIRNCLRQSFGDIESSTIVCKLDKILNGASLLITGNYDREHMPFFMDMLEARFKEISHNIWGKIDYKSVSKNWYLMPKCL